MSKDKDSTDPNPSPENGDSEDAARSEQQPPKHSRLAETTEIEETIPISREDNLATQDDLDKTIASELDATVDSISEGETRGTGESLSESATEKTVGDASDATQVIDSALGDIDVTQTINPRELSKEDAAAWDEMTVGSIANETNRTPDAADGDSSYTHLDLSTQRSFSETKLQIRDRDVAAPKDDPNTPSDYRLVRMLGKGGMGNVYVARQESLDRMIAVKVIKPLEGKRRDHLEQTGRLEQVERDRRHQFLSEAVVTGDLDHPNIVPIHDIAVTSDNTLFYAMKRVVGTPWSKVIAEKTRDENLDILLKVCDAVGFAHTRGVVHRDIKPENIMLGDFGVVMLMDWGLALAQPGFEKLDSIAHVSGLGGTPAFMAPEMATGPLEDIGPPADIYLLGATLFLIVTGTPPHHAENVSLCLKAVTANTIRDFDDRHRGELLDIALKAMSTDPEDRYADVRELQEAIRQYRSHAESVSLTVRAAEDLRLANENLDYADFSRARFGFEQALSLWDGNQPAAEGLAETSIAHATAARDKEDFDLGLSLLDADNETHQPLIEELTAGRRLRQQRTSRLRLFKRVAAALLAFILVGGSVAVYLIDAKRKEAVKATSIATQQKQIAQAQTEEARRQEKIAKTQERIAVRARTEAETARTKEKRAREETEKALVKVQNANAATAAALVAKEEALMEAEQSREVAVAAAASELKLRKEADAQAARAEYETYLSQIGLAKARVESNEFDDARRILDNVRTLRESQQGGLAWEWRWLWRQANQSLVSARSPAALTNLALAPSTDRSPMGGIAVSADGQLQAFALNSGGELDRLRSVSLGRTTVATAVAVSPSGDAVAVGTTRGDIQVWDRNLTELRQTLLGHESQVTRMQFVENDLLVSGATDKTARLWNVRTSTPVETCWHIAPVRDVAARKIGKRVVLATAVSDNSTGRAVVWSIRNDPDSDRFVASPMGEFAEHRNPISSVALSPNGDVAATGDVSGNVFLWQVSDASTTDYTKSIASAVKGIGSDGAMNENAKDTRIRFRRFVDLGVVVDNARDDQADRSPDSPGRAHDDVVESVRFSRDGKTLLTASDDYTLKVWDPASVSLLTNLRGHGGWVTDASFVNGSADDIVSISNDLSVRRWNAKTYVGAAKTSSQRLVTVHSESDAPAFSQAHLDEIWSARFDSTGTRVVSASRDHSARVLEIDPVTMAFSEVATMQDESEDRLSEGTSFMAMSFGIDRDHGRLFVGSADATIRIWDLEKGNEIGQASGTGLNSAFALSRDGTLLLTGSSSTADKAILWRVDPTGDRSPKVLWRVRQHDQAVTAFAVSDDGKHFFTGDRHGLGYLWDVETGAQVGESIEDVRGYRINAACFSSDGRQLMLAGDDQQVTRIDLASRERISRLSHDGFVTQLSLSADGTHAVTVSETITPDRVETSARLWDLVTEEASLLHRTVAETESSRTSARITSAHFGDQDRWVVVGVASTGERNAQVMRFDTRAEAKQSKPTTLQLPRQLNALQAAMPIGNQRLVTLNGDAAFLWDLNSMDHIKSYRDHGAVTQAAFSHDGRFVVTASRSVKIWDAETGKSLGKLESPHEGLVRSIDFSPTSMRLATVGDDGIAKVWLWKPAEQTFELLRQFDVSTSDSTQRPSLRCVRFSPDGSWLLVGGAAGTTRLLSLTQEPSIESANLDLAESGDITCVAFSSDGKWIAMGSDDKIVRMRKITDLDRPTTEAIRFVGHADQIEDVSIVQDASGEMRLLTASRDKSARVWDPRVGSDDRVGREVIALRRHSQGVTAVDHTSDGSTVMTAGRDGAVILWPAAAALPPGASPSPRTAR